MKDAILDWFAHGERGISSEAMACAIAGMKIQKRSSFGNYPHDPDDFKRCLKFLVHVPEARMHMDKVAKLGKRWANLVENWDELEKLFHEEFPTGSAPKLYKRMKELTK